jgi:hypothetical protein
MRAAKLPSAIHYLNEVARDYIQGSDIQTQFNQAAQSFKDSSKEVYLMTNKSTAPFIGYISHHDKLIGDWDVVDLFVIGETRRFNKGLNINQLVQSNPTKLTDFGIDALRTLVSHGVVNADNLAREKYCIPNVNGTGFQMAIVNALTPQLPSYFVRKLINELPEATKNDAESPYHAAYEYAQQHPNDYRTALRELKDILDNASTPQATGLTDEIVAKYISDKYGQSMEDVLNNLCVPTAQKLYTSTYFLGEEDRDLSAEELVSKVKENPMSVCGTMDELLIAFCTQENFSREHTINELIDFINDVEVAEKPTIQQQVASFAVENSINMETTLQEFVDGSKHVFVDDADVAIDLIRNCPTISDNVKNDVIRSILDDIPVDYPDITTTLSTAHIPDDIISAILVASQTGVFNYPEKPVTDEAVVTYLTRAGIPRTEATAIASGNIPETNNNTLNLQGLGISETGIQNILAGDFSKLSVNEVSIILKPYLSNLGYTDYEISKVLAGNAHATQQSQFFVLEDKGYKAANSLLIDLRNALSTADSDDLRSSLLPIVYSYLRVLMLKSGDEKDAAEFLESKKSGCSEQVSSYIDKAVTILAD